MFHDLVQLAFNAPQPVINRTAGTADCGVVGRVVTTIAACDTAATADCSGGGDHVDSRVTSSGVGVVSVT